MVISAHEPILIANHWVLSVSCKAFTSKWGEEKPSVYAYDSFQSPINLEFVKEMIQHLAINYKALCDLKEDIALPDRLPK